MDEVPLEEWCENLVFKEELQDDVGEETQKWWRACLLSENGIDH
jgi:hypothetical protein